MAGARAFREAYLHADQVEPDSYTDWGARQLRYEVLWAYYMGNAYRDALHSWAKQMRASFGMYKWTRDIYNPAYRLGQFYRTYIWGGRLDMMAGDGKQEPSALPIVTDNDALRPAIATLWRSSNWKVSRRDVPLMGSVLGDAFIEVVDDLERGKVYLRQVHPATVKDVVSDPFGNVKGYTLEYERMLPDSTRTSTYSEVVSRDGDAVVYQTFSKGAPFAWGDVMVEGQPVSTWAQPYGFVPLVHIKHQNLGLDYGGSELLPRLSLFREVDDQGSKLNDQVRKTVDAAWLFAGMRKPDSSPTVTGAETSTTKPEAGRDEVPAFYSSDPAAKAQPLVAPLDIAAVAANIGAMLATLEKDYPELNLYRLREGQGLSGRAIRLVRQDAESKALDLRDVYDDALVRAQQMAIAIGGWRKYDGFAGFGLESYAAGDLQHEIGDRPVFASDPLDTEEVEAARLDNVQRAVNLGWDAPAYMEQRGYSEEAIASMAESERYQAQTALLVLNSAPIDEG